MADVTPIRDAQKDHLLTPQNAVLALIDYQPEQYAGVGSMDQAELVANVTLLGKVAKTFELPIVLSTVYVRHGMSGTNEELRRVLPGVPEIDRTTMNSWEDPQITDRVNRHGRDKIVLAGLWTSVCISGPALSALEQGYQVYVIADACGDVSDEAHQRAMERMIQAGARPLTALTYLLELQRDWARGETYDLTTGIARELGGAYGLGITYAKTMFGASEGHR